jgi:hypothetical protein
MSDVYLINIKNLFDTTQNNLIFYMSDVYLIILGFLYWNQTRPLHFIHQKLICIFLRPYLNKQKIKFFVFKITFFISKYWLSKIKDNFTIFDFSILEY